MTLKTVGELKKAIQKLESSAKISDDTPLQGYDGVEGDLPVRVWVEDVQSPPRLVISTD